MSVLIKGMGMPKNCGECRFAGACGVHNSEEWPDIESIILNDVIGVGGTRDEDCPLVPVPPHGRLIDADAADDYAYDELEVSYSYLSPREASRNMQLIYRNMPTIIEAEGE